MNPKALNLEALNLLESNVTLGFKCEASLKLHLAHQANLFGYTLSSYVHNLVSENQKFIDDILDDSSKENSVLNKKILFYENDILKSLFENNKEKVVSYKTNVGEDVRQKIVTLEDVYTIIINSFKSV